MSYRLPNTIPKRFGASLSFVSDKLVIFNHKKHAK